MRERNTDGVRLDTQMRERTTVVSKLSLVRERRHEIVAHRPAELGRPNVVQPASTTVMPTGASAMTASLMCCTPNGIPMMVTKLATADAQRATLATIAAAS